jgi:hypothetical protein
MPPYPISARLIAAFREPSSTNDCAVSSFCVCRKFGSFAMICCQFGCHPGIVVVRPEPGYDSVEPGSRAPGFAPP